jgi:tetraacyldisaccharide 4'-kinase
VASWRTRLHLALSEAWQRRGLLAWLLSPLAALHYLVYRTRRLLYALGALRTTRLDVPVIVVGNVYVGGTGKTPLTIELARALAVRGYRPGIVSRGYGASASQPRLVSRDDSARRVGDEPLLMARAAGVPVAVGRRRPAAGRLLRAAHPECDVILADDGLQHWALARDVEIAVLNERGLGNGWLLPAGPLREPGGRLTQVDALVCNGDVPPVPVEVPCYAMHGSITVALPLFGDAAALPLAALAQQQRQQNMRLLAAAGIGGPDRFFAMLRAAGLVIEEMPLADHYPFDNNPFAAVAADLILITEKDAVKCRGNPALAADRRVYVVPLATTLDTQLVETVLARLAQASGRTVRGSTPA